MVLELFLLFHTIVCEICIVIFKVTNNKKDAKNYIDFDWHSLLFVNEKVFSNGNNSVS